VRALGFVTVAAVLLGPCVARASPDDPAATLRGAAEQCLRSNAARATAASQTLTEAVTFLVDDLCASEISRSNTYQASVKTLEAMQADPPKPKYTISATHPVLSDFEQQQNADSEHQAALVKQAKVNPTTGELDTPGDLDMSLRTRAMLGPMFGTLQSTAAFKSMAAKAVLDAKEAAKH
jgi:hypothetical protein